MSSLLRPVIATLTLVSWNCGGPGPLGLEDSIPQLLHIQSVARNQRSTLHSGAANYAVTFLSETKLSDFTAIQTLSGRAPAAPIARDPKGLLCVAVTAPAAEPVAIMGIYNPSAAATDNRESARRGTGTYSEELLTSAVSI
jgi:hypothetical protein